MIDTHCHIHDPAFFSDGVVQLQEALARGVETLVCVGTSAADSERAAAFAQTHKVWAAVAQHPHDVDTFNASEQATISNLVTHPRVIAIGECGLDFYYNNSSREQQIAALRWHLQLAQDHNLPVLFHIREAFSEFWPIFDEFHARQPVRGLVHSFSATVRELDQCLERGLYVAFNGIMTFTKNNEQLEAVRRAPLEKIMLETDAPFLTPVPYRGKVNKPKYVYEVADFIAKERGESLATIQAATVRNAKDLLGI